MKTTEELMALKKEVEILNKKLAELAEDELKQIIGGCDIEFSFDSPTGGKEFNLYTNTKEKDFKPTF